MSITSIAQNATTIFEHTPVNHAALVPVSLAFMGVAIVVVFLRLYTRHFMTRRLWWDDAIIFAALFPSVGLSVDGYYGPRYGWGHHAQDIPALETYVVGFLKTLWISSLTFTLATGLIKCSLLVFYLRITAGGAHQTLRKTTWAALAIVVTWTIIMTVLVCIQCTPTSAFWSIPDYATRNAACLPWAAKESFYLGQGIANIIGDFFVVLLPVKYIVGLRLPLAQKLILLVLICLGLLASVSGILRVVYVSETFKTADTTWEGLMTFELACLEVNTSIICASIPGEGYFNLSRISIQENKQQVAKINTAIKPLGVKLFPRFGLSSSRGKSSGNSSQALSSIMEDPDGKV